MTVAARPRLDLSRIASAPGRTLLRTFPSLHVPNYRLYVASQLLTNPLGWMQRIAQDWLILQLSGNVALVGLTVTLQMGPMLLFGLWGGMLADRYDKRKILMVTQSLFAATALGLGLLVVTGLVQPWHILVSAFVLGLAIVADNPARQAFVVEVAGGDNLRNAISLNSTVFQMGGLVGPALAGVSIAAIGEGPSFLLNSAAGVVAVSLLARMDPSRLRAAPRVPRDRGQLRAGLQHILDRPVILWTIVLIGFVALTGINLATVLTAYADRVFGSGAGGYGLLSASLATGAVIGSVASTRRVRVGLRQLVYLALGVGLLQLAAALTGAQVLFALVLVAVGAVTLLYLTGGNTLIQTTVDPQMRGRVMAVYVMVLFGAQAASGTLIGFVADHWGAQAAMLATASGPLLGALVVGSLLAHRRRLRPVVILHDRPGRGFLYVQPRDLHRAA
ncbi:MAG TPA: MFS transporter [Actinotalea caeni]|uniref:MFS transporter n=1 Tax=Actinotalea caeni TaxID=1348467 RepID=UPI00139181DB|nr:MFS transporter [Actinotalea caeni]HLV56318.1 MFS transporter [Actinotalea caeni]